MEDLRTVGESIRCFPQTSARHGLSVIFETDYGLTMRYELTMSMLFLACNECYSRVVSIQEVPECAECKKRYPAYENVPLLHFTGSSLAKTVENWSFNLLAPFELAVIVNPVGRALKELVANFQGKGAEEKLSSEATIAEVCRILSGPLYF